MLLIRLILLISGVVMAGSALAGDLEVTLDKEVAGITQDMELAASRQGRIESEVGREVAQVDIARVDIPVLNVLPAVGSKKRSTMPTITKNLLKQTGFVVSDPVYVGTIVDSLDNTYISKGPDAIIYIDIGIEDGVAVGDRFTVFHRERVIRHPIYKEDNIPWIPSLEKRPGEMRDELFIPRGRVVGEMVRIMGFIEVVEPGQGLSKAIIRESYDSVEPGQAIMPFHVVSDPAPTNTGQEKQIEGYIIAHKAPKHRMVMNDLVFIDKGAADNVQPGDRFEVVVSIDDVKKSRFDKFYENWVGKETPGHPPIMPETIAELQVIATEANTSTLLVLKGTQDIYKVGHRVRYKP